jgi:chorismate synthase
MLRFTTAGESHGPALVSILEGAPAGIPLVASDIDSELARRQMGYGRGRRMQIEQDVVEILSGVRAGETLGSPIAMMIRNRDWENWRDVMSPAPDDPDAAPRRREVTRPRPGHADLAGMIKYDRRDARDILERASARETTARVAAGAVCRRFLRELGVTIGSHIVELGGIEAESRAELPDDLNGAADKSAVRTLDPAAEDRMVAAIDAAKKAGDTLGGVAEIVCRGQPVGLGSHVSWDRKLDGRIAQAMMSIPAVKGVGIGIGFAAARRKGSEVHDEIVPGHGLAGTSRATNRAGGLEGGITNGEPLVVRVAMKPISTLMKPLGTVDMKTGEAVPAAVERSDVTAVPAMGVIAEAMLAFVVADAMLEKFGGDSMSEVKRNLEGYISSIRQAAFR